MAAVLIALLFAIPQDSLEKRIVTLLEKLRAEEIEVREAAAKELIALGEPAAPHYEKAAADSADPETAARLKAILVQVRRNTLILKVAPPVKLVTVSAKEVPLRDFLGDVCAQAGVEFTCDIPSGEKNVTLEAKGEPLLQVVDRACAARGDITAAITDGRLKVSAGKFSADASAYAQGYRIKIRKTVVTDIVEAGAVKSSIALYFDVDAQPDQKVRTSNMTTPRAATIEGGGEVAIKGVADGAGRMGVWMGAGAGAVIVDGVAVAYEGNDSLDRIVLIKDAPAGLKRLESLKIGARFRYSVGVKPVTIPLRMGNSDKLPDIPYNLHFSNAQLYFMPTDGGRGTCPPLEDFMELDPIVLVGKDGKEFKATPMPGGMIRGRQYMFTFEQRIPGSDTPQLRVNVMDLVDRDVEFELKDVRLRD